MIIRRQLREKVLHVLYACFNSPEGSLQQADKELNTAIKKYFDLYHLIFLLILELRDQAIKKIDISRNKLLPSPEDMNPSENFVNNRILVQLAAHRPLFSYINNEKVSWGSDLRFVKTLYEQLLQEEFFKAYLELPQTTYKNDKEMLLCLASDFLPDNETVEQVLEDQSIYWNDDYSYALAMVLSTIQNMKPGMPAENLLLPLYRQDEDKNFVATLLHKVIMNQDENEALIREHTKNWDYERIALIDKILLQMAIVELTAMPSIPVKVTLNEYIEIAKYYSTPKSCTFINGIIDTVAETLRSQQKINKTGRGLLDA